MRGLTTPTPIPAATTGSSTGSSCSVNAAYHSPCSITSPAGMPRPNAFACAVTGNGLPNHTIATPIHATNGSAASSARGSHVRRSGARSSGTTAGAHSSARSMRFVASSDASSTARTHRSPAGRSPVTVATNAASSTYVSGVSRPDVA